MTTFVAEVSSNHYRDLERCYRFIDQAAAVGCQAVKFQLFKIEELFAPQILAQSAVHRQRKEWELPLEFLPLLAKRCQCRGIQFSCTPFYLRAVAELLPYVDFYKIASYELLWTELLEACAATGKPIVLSTGMATLAEVTAAVTTLRQAGCRELTLLHCVSGYPTPPQECNLAALDTLRRAFGCAVGWSDHSACPAVIYRAVNYWRAALVEFHLDLDGCGKEYAAGHCWLPQDIQQVIDTLRIGERADGSGEKQPTSVEQADREWRADPQDGLRPLKKIREHWRPDNT